MRSGGRAVLVLLSGLFLTVSARAQEIEDPQFGLGLGYSSRFEQPVYTVEFVMPVYHRVDVEGSLQYLDLDSRRRYVGNVDVQVRFPTHRIHSRTFGWVGMGFGLITDDPKGPSEATTRDGQLNVLLGLGYDAPASPYVQLRFTRRHEVILGIGVRF